ncbi:hypothetical protein O181_102330 [Austropuccinia psidii MF-1]|uniref:Uncharacterized protein n=1 Tax=Austropuccinia psidii MF-1 TaxID=1389203 RepID=A0A9Q3JJD0_9BASI|nr:hypothetical protein [Austropuccinia psidii MF-1]
MSPVHLKDLCFQRHQPEDRKCLSRTRIPRREHLGHSGGWKDIEGNHTHSAIHIPIQQKPQTRQLEGYGSSYSASPTPQGPFSMEHGQQEVQTGIPLGRTWRKFPEDLSQRDRLQRPHGNHQRISSPINRNITPTQIDHNVVTPENEESQIPGELEHVLKCRCNHNCTLDDIANTLQDIRKRTNIGKYSPYKSTGFKKKQPFRVEFKDKPGEKVEEVTKKKNSFHNCGSTDHYANNCPKAKKKVYAIEKVPEEESLTEDFESDSTGDGITEKSDEEHDQREQFLVEYQEETHLKSRTYSWKKAFHKTLPIKTYANIHRMHRHSWSHQLKEWHTYMGQSQK